MGMQSFLNATHWIRVTTRARSGVSAPNHWLVRAASLVLAGTAGFFWVLGEIFSYVLRAAESEMGE